ncbi:YijD family membrane protein [Serratia microhaemolytica]|uniref:YijD family membrane protein n=1 Tax=Serratia microhaemolytica TaxID=2675110 RepID=UPI000FDE8F48|nr:YijD family membrane protein [Serratia microhaemolytica]
MKKTKQDSGTLLLALVAGLSVNGSFSALFNSLVPFSLFPLLSLMLSAYCLHQLYLDRAMSEGMPKLVTACFLLGIFIYSAIIRTEFPQMGSNFMPVTLCAVLLLWIVVKLRARGSSTD